MNPKHTDSPPEYGSLRPRQPFLFLFHLARNSPLGRGGLRRSLKHLFIRNRLEVIDVEIDGLKMRIHLTGNTCEWKFACNRNYISKDMDFLTDGVDCAKANFVDIGANAGIFSLQLAYKGARVIAVEPHPIALQWLHFNVQANDLTDRITIVDAAVSDVTGQMMLSLHDEDIGSSSLTPIDTSSTAMIAVMPLKDILAETGITGIDGLKIDIEGLEDHALIPFIRDTPKTQWPKRIVIEHIHRQRWSEDCIKALQKAGYETKSIEKNNTFLQLK
jgi:FkbM family methyltransferase